MEQSEVKWFAIVISREIVRCNLDNNSIWSLSHLDPREKREEIHARTVATTQIMHIIHYVLKENS